MECGLWGFFKRIAVDSGENFSPDSAASIQGTKQHTVAEVALRIILVDGGASPDIAKYVRQALKTTRVKLTAPDAIENIEIAVRAAFELIPDTMRTELEFKVPLSHEPESFGTLDIAGVRSYDYTGVEYVDHVLVADYKFGEMPVSPDCHQLKIYAANFCEFLLDAGYSIVGSTRVQLAIIQPKIHREAVVREFEYAQLFRYRSHVEHVVEKQVSLHDMRGAGSLSVCDWCDFRDRCHHRPTLVSGLLQDIGKKKEGGMLADAKIEEIVKSRSAFKKVIDECTALVVDNVDRFPNWTRAKVANAEKWSPLMEEEDIQKTLEKKGAKDLFTLSQPKRVRDSNPDLATTIDRYVMERGEHVRLYEGAPKKRAPEKEPVSRPKTNKKTTKPVKTKTAKKKTAKKKAAKKKVARKKSKK